MPLRENAVRSRPTMAPRSACESPSSRPALTSAVASTVFGSGLGRTAADMVLLLCYCTFYALLVQMQHLLRFCMRLHRFDPRFERLGGHRPRIEKPLYERAALGEQDLVLAGGFDALGDDGERELVA